MIKDVIRYLNIKDKFRIKDNFEFIAFDDITHEDYEKSGQIHDFVEIWAAVKIYYEGTLPESYKILNFIIGEWVLKNSEKLTRVVHKELKTHFKENYEEELDLSSLDELDRSAIWEEQLDYMPVVNDDEKSMVIEIELVIDVIKEE